MTKKSVKKSVPYKVPAGLSESAVDAFIAEAEELDRGTERYPWSKKAKAAIKSGLQELPDIPAMKAKVNELVLKKLGGGLHGRGPFWP